MEACDAVGVAPDKLKEAKKKDDDLDKKLRDFMCRNFYDIRTFGAVMTTFVKGALNCGQVRGPVQMGFARSVDLIVPQEVTVTRVTITKESDAEKKDTEMGRKYIRCSAALRTGYVSGGNAVLRDPLRGAILRGRYAAGRKRLRQIAKQCVNYLAVSKLICRRIHS